MFPPAMHGIEKKDDMAQIYSQPVRFGYNGLARIKIKLARMELKSASYRKVNNVAH